MRVVYKTKQKPHDRRSIPRLITTPQPSTTPLQQLSIKVSAFFRVSSAQWPFTNLAARLEALKRAYGAHRLMWGR